ncbi:LIM domain only protein 7 [Armadillidium vulgare]|nr:LIM domain only protein 7 [Armadillidium vulgare]
MRYTSQTDFKTNFDSIPVKEKSKEKGNDIGNGNKNSTSVDSKNTSSDKVLLDRLHRSRSVDGNSGRKDSQAKDQDYFQDDFRFLGKALNKQLFDYKRNENKFSENFEDVPKTKNILDSHMKSKMISAKSEEDLRVKNGEFSKGKNISEELTKINLDKNKSNSFSSLPINDKIEFFEINKTNSKSLAELSSPKDSYKSFSKSLTELSSAEGSYKSVYSSPFPSYLRNTNKNSMSTDISGLHNLNTPDYLNELPEKYNTHRVSTTREEDEPLTTLFARNLDKVKKLLSTSESDLLLATKELPNSIENFDKTERMDSGKRESTNSENDFRNTSHEYKEFCKSFDKFIYSDLSSSKEKSTLAPSSNEMKSYSDATAIHRSGCQSSLEYSSNSSKLRDTSLLHAYNGGGSSQVHTSLTLKDDVARKKHKKLAELEQEMEKHDRVMLQRVQGSSSQDKLSTFDHETSSDIPSTHLQYNGSIAPTVEAPPLPEPNNNTVPQTQNLQHVSNSENIQHRRQQEVYSTPFYKHESNEYKSVDSSSYYSRQKNTQETTYSELPSVSREIKKVVGRDPLSKSLSDGAPPPPVPRKQSILALSAIPKPKLTENESWIMKRKTETTKKDYSKHWLIQEAEQRRLEQQERITRPNQIPLNKQTNLQTTPGYQTHFQNIKSSFNSASYNQNQNIYSNTSVQNNVNTSAGFNGPNSSPTRPSSDLPPNRFISNNEPVTNATTVSPTIAPNNNWMKQTKTYQPQQATSPSSSNSKPLPDAIISSITQRVNNKFNNGNNRTPIYNSATCNAKDEEDYHDYMNTGSLNVGSSYNNNNKTNNSTSPVGSPTGTPGQHFSSHVPPAGQQGQVGEDQRLLSVSGKKKCSHCGEELGRGAAMIIESLRLFYHIPCFKCCVCGIQLGNGTSGADVRVRNHKLHCHNCYSNDEGKG